MSFESVAAANRTAVAKRLASQLASVSAALMLAACAAVGTDYKVSEPVAPAAWHSDMAGGLAADPVAQKTLAVWWQQFNDPQLSTLIEKTLIANPDLRSARAALREARARRAIAGAGLYPTVGASASGRRNTPASAASGNELYAVGFDASWEPDVFGSARRGVEAAQADMEASAATLDATQVSLVAEAALNYVDARALQARLAIARSNFASQQETLQLTNWREQAGLVGAVELEQARANLEQTRAQVPVLEKSLAEARNRLAILAGEAPGALDERLAQLAPVPVAPQQMAVGIPADALRHRPDVRAAERRVAAETARTGQAQAAFYPSFSLTGSIGLESLALNNLGTGTVTRSFIASIAATIFDAGLREQRLAAQDAVREQAVIAYESTVLTALEDVENALSAFARSKERQTALRAAADAARNAALLARQRYASGLIDFQTVLDTERSLLTIEDTLAVAQQEGASSVVTLYKALGGGWSSGAASDH